MDIAQWLLFEEQMRSAEDLNHFKLTLVNLMAQVFPYQQSILYVKHGNRHTVTHASSVSEIDRRAPSILWLEKEFLPWISSKAEQANFVDCEQMDLDPAFAHCRQALIIPLFSPKIGSWGIVYWLDEGDYSRMRQLLPLMQHSILHAFEKLSYEGKGHRRKRTYGRWLWLSIAVLIVFALALIKVPQTVLAQAQVEPLKPQLITTSLNGTIKQILVTPNERVKQHQLLFTLDDITIKNQLEEAEQNLNLAKERYMKAYRHAFTNEESRQEMNILKAQSEQAAISKRYYARMLERTQIRANESGMVLYSDPNHFIGKPIKIGQRVMLLANPKQKVLNFWVAIDDMIAVDKQKNARFFPNLQPLSTIESRINYINPIAETRPDGSLAYFGVAQLLDKDVKLGEKGLVKLYGRESKLFFYLFRRPIRFFRQQLGW